MKVTNATRETLNFLKKGGGVKDGAAETVSIAPGETDDLDIDLDHAQVKGAILASALIVPEKVAARVAESTTTPAPKGR